MKRLIFAAVALHALLRNAGFSPEVCRAAWTIADEMLKQEKKS